MLIIIVTAFWLNCLLLSVNHLGVYASLNVECIFSRVIKMYSLLALEGILCAMNFVSLLLIIMVLSPSY
jgi:hypothetical protein